MSWRDTQQGRSCFLWAVCGGHLLQHFRRCNLWALPAWYINSKKAALATVACKACSKRTVCISHRNASDPCSVCNFQRRTGSVTCVSCPPETFKGASASASLIACKTCARGSFSRLAACSCTKRHPEGTRCSYGLDHASCVQWVR